MIPDACTRLPAWAGEAQGGGCHKGTLPQPDQQAEPSVQQITPFLTPTNRHPCQRRYPPSGDHFPSTHPAPPSSRKPFSQYPRTHLTSGSNPQKSTNSRIPAATETPPGRGVSRGVSSPQRHQPTRAATITRQPAKSPSFRDLSVEGRRLITPCRSSTSAAFYAEPLAAAASHSVPQ